MQIPRLLLQKPGPSVCTRKGARQRRRARQAAAAISCLSALALIVQAGQRIGLYHPLRQRQKAKNRHMRHPTHKRCIVLNHHAVTGTQRSLRRMRVYAAARLCCLRALMKLHDGIGIIIIVFNFYLVCILYAIPAGSCAAVHNGNKCPGMLYSLHFTASIGLMKRNLWAVTGNALLRACAMSVTASA